MQKDRTILWIHRFPIFCKSFSFFFLQTNRLNFSFYYLLSDICYLPNSEYSQLSDERYVVQKPMWNVVGAINKTKLCSKYQRKVEYKIYREEYYLALRNLYFIEVKPTILNIFCLLMPVCVCTVCLPHSYDTSIEKQSWIFFMRVKGLKRKNVKKHVTNACQQVLHKKQLISKS